MIRSWGYDKRHWLIAMPRLNRPVPNPTSPLQSNPPLGTIFSIRDGSKLKNGISQRRKHRVRPILLDKFSAVCSTGLQPTALYLMIAPANYRARSAFCDGRIGSEPLTRIHPAAAI